MNTGLQSQRLSNSATKTLYFCNKINEIMLNQLKQEKIVSTRAYAMKKIAVHSDKTNKFEERSGEITLILE